LGGASCRDTCLICVPGHCASLSSVLSRRIGLPLAHQKAICHLVAVSSASFHRALAAIIINKIILPVLAAPAQHCGSAVGAHGLNHSLHQPAACLHHLRTFSFALLYQGN